MCGECEINLEQYNHSLKSKTNLLNTRDNRQNSFSNTSQFDNMMIIAGDSNQGAPKNLQAKKVQFQYEESDDEDELEVRIIVPHSNLFRQNYNY